MNRKPFNRSGFNRPNTVVTSVTGFAQLKMGANPVFAHRTISARPAPSALSMTGAAAATLVKAGTGGAGLRMQAAANPVRVVSGLSELSRMALRTAAEQSVQGEAVIDLQGLILGPGDELIINTEDMTVTVNRQNGMDHFAMDSDFFTLLSGWNTVVYADEQTSRAIAFDIIWKDRWL